MYPNRATVGDADLAANVYTGAAMETPGVVRQIRVSGWAGIVCAGIAGLCSGYWGLRLILLWRIDKGLDRPWTLYHVWPDSVLVFMTLLVWALSNALGQGRAAWRLSCIVLLAVFGMEAVRERTLVPAVIALLLAGLVLEQWRRQRRDPNLPSIFPAGIATGVGLLLLTLYFSSQAVLASRLLEVARAGLDARTRVRLQRLARFCSILDSCSTRAGSMPGDSLAIRNLLLQRLQLAPVGGVYYFGGEDEQIHALASHFTIACDEWVGVDIGESSPARGRWSVVEDYGITPFHILIWLGNNTTPAQRRVSSAIVRPGAPGAVPQR